MGLPLPGHDREVAMESFSHNILKFELSGPDYEHFSVVDLPGLFRSIFSSFKRILNLTDGLLEPTAGQTTKGDMKLVKNMVGKHLKNPRSIILLACHYFKIDSTPLTCVRAVVPANVDIATQEIVQMAEDADPQGQRTLGVLTKPDLVDKGAEDKVEWYLWVCENVY
jgi:hypothetical protein